MNETSHMIDDSAPRSPWQSLKRGWQQKCPCCGTGLLYGNYLKVNPECATCKTELHHHRADDAPPYFVMFITAHVIVGGILALEQTMAPPTWVHLVLWLPLLVLFSLWLLPRVKGALVGYQWALRMHGFGSGEFEGADIPPAQSESAS